MTTTKDGAISRLDDRPLLDTAKVLAAAERHATAALLGALMEIDRRRLYLGEGCASMFAYCTQVLHLAEGAAYNRIEAARAARDYPVILDLLERSAITLTAVRLLAPHLTAANHGRVLESARHKSKREVEELVAALRPRPDAPAIMRKLPSASVESPTLVAITSSTQAASPRLVEVPANGAPLSLASVRPRCERAAVVPLAPERYRIQLTVSRETHDKFRRAQSLLRHAVPSGDAAEIFDRAITLLVGSLERQRFAETSRPRAARVSNASPQRSRHISASVRRAVWHRDGGRCAFIGAAGPCREMALLEFHHVEPYAAGGVASLENLELRCRAHNEYEARLYFGDGVVRECGTRSFG